MIYKEDALFEQPEIQSMTSATIRQRVLPIFQSNLNLSKRSRNLKQPRDMLLPKLISGQIELKD